jgi:hypothetical protein
MTKDGARNSIMKIDHIIVRFSFVWPALAICLLGAGCGDSFKKAEATNTEQAYQQFINEHPDSPQIPEAKRHIRALALATAGKAKTVEAWSGFLTRFADAANSEECKQARQELENLREGQEWKDATTKNNADGYLSYINKFPAGAHITEAAAKYQEIHDSTTYRPITRADGIDFSMDVKRMDFTDGGRHMEGSISNFRVVDRRGAPQNIALTTDRVVDGNIETTQFGVIKFSVPDATDPRVEYQLTKRQLDQIKEFLRSR